MPNPTAPHGATDTPQGDDTPPTTEATDTAGTAPQGDDDGTEGTDWKTAARQWERRAKRDAAALAAARADADRALAEARADADAAREAARLADLERVRFRVAADAGLPVDLADRLRGDDEAELRADAEALRARLRPGTGTPAVDAGTGRGAADGVADLNRLFRIAAGKG